MRALIDTCIVIDALQNRSPFANDARAIFYAAADNRFDGYVTAKSTADIYYLMHRYTHSDKETRDVLRRLGSLFEFLDTSAADCINAIESNIRDYEDAKRLGILKGLELPKIVSDRLGESNSSIINTLVNDLIEGADIENGIGFSDDIFEAVSAFSEFNYKYIYRSDILNGYTRYFTRLITLIVNYLEEIYSSYGLDEKGYVAEKNMLAAGFYNHIREMYGMYIQREGSDKRMIMDYVAGMTDNFCLDCANEILKPEHLNDEIEMSQTGKWFDAPY